MPNITYCHFYSPDESLPNGSTAQPEPIEPNDVLAPGTEIPDNHDPIKQAEKPTAELASANGEGSAENPNADEQPETLSDLIGGSRGTLDQVEISAPGPDLSPEFKAQLRALKFEDAWPKFTTGLERNLREAIGFNQEQLTSIMDWVQKELEPMAVIFMLQDNQGQLEVIRFRLRSKLREQEYAVHQGFHKIIISTIVESFNLIRVLI